MVLFFFSYTTLCSAKFFSFALLGSYLKPRTLQLIMFLILEMAFFVFLTVTVRHRCFQYIEVVLKIQVYINNIAFFLIPMSTFYEDPL